jgi:hypothetical protein
MALFYLTVTISENYFTLSDGDSVREILDEPLAARGYMWEFERFQAIGMHPIVY